MKALILSMTFFALTATAHATTPASFDELDPSSPDIEKTLLEMDADYERTTGQSPFLENDNKDKGNCFRNSCKVWAYVNISTQRLYLYIDGALKYTWKVSTGTIGHGTPDMDSHPNGRIYDAYSSSKYPGGDYNGLGNMPYAVFIRGGYAIHGTTRGSWPDLGRKASHGCVRLHPDNAYIFNRLVRSNGIGDVWITVN